MNHALIFNCHNIDASRPPGGYRIASFLREHGWDVEVIEWTQHWSLEELKELCKSRITDNTVFCGFSTFFSFWNDHLETFVGWLKSSYPDVKLVLGGQSRPRMLSKSIDYYIHGYGEFAILELCKSFTGNTPIEGIKFDPVYSDKKVISAIHSYPAYPMKSLLTKYENRDFLEPEEWLTMEFSRGCIFKCLYCNFPILGVKDDHTRDAEDFYVQMMDTYDRFGIKNYYMADETFNDYSSKIIKYADAAERLPFDPWFSGFVRADLLVSRPQDWEHFARLGVLGHYYGVETMNQETAKAIGKGMKVEKLQEGLIAAKNYFNTHGRKQYRGTISLVLGLPHETVESINKSFDWLSANWQGESQLAFPLEIPKQHNNNVMSTLGMNYEKYGYRIVPVTKPHQSFIHIKHITEPLNWENDHLTYEQCKKIADDWIFKSITSYKFAWDVFSLSRFVSLDQVHTELRPEITYTFRDVVDSYIAKKLNI